jgi:hypothetical protein
MQRVKTRKESSALSLCAFVPLSLCPYLVIEKTDPTFHLNTACKKDCDEN